MTSPDTLFADRQGIHTARSVLRAAADALAEVDAAAIDAGIAGAVPGGSAVAQALADAAAAVDRAAAALSDRASGLAEQCGIALAHLETTDQDFASALTAVGAQAPAHTTAPATPGGTATS